MLSQYGLELDDETLRLRIYGFTNQNSHNAKIVRYEPYLKILTTDYRKQLPQPLLKQSLEPIHGVRILLDKSTPHRPMATNARRKEMNFKLDKNHYLTIYTRFCVTT